MPILRFYDEEQRLGLWVWSGELTAEMWQTGARANQVDPNLRAMRRVLVDIRRAQLDESIDVEAVRLVAKQWADNGGLAGKPVAVVASSGFWIARTFEEAMTSEGGRVIVFNDLHTACIWIDIDPVATRHRLEQMTSELGEH